MNKRAFPILVVSLVVLALGLVFVLGGANERTTERAAAAVAPERAVAQPRPADVARPTGGDADLAASRPLATSADTASTPQTAGARREALAGVARGEIEVRIEAPQGAPGDPSLSVVAVPATLLADDSPSEVLASLDGSELRVAVAEDGRALLPWPPRGDQLLMQQSVDRWRLLLDGDWLALEDPPAFDLEAPPESIVLRPKLGALVVVSFSSSVSGRIELAGSDFSGRRPRFARRESVFRDTREVRLRAVDAGLDWTLVPRLEGRHADMQLGVSADPGETQVVALTPTAGATVRGRVVGEDGKGIADLLVETTSSSPWMGGMDVYETRTDARGAFVLDALPPGQTEVRAEREGYVTAQTEMLDLADGETLGGVELVLTRGASLRGRVQFPGGSPAEATVVVEALRQRGGFGGWGGSRMRGVGKATTEADGTFVVSGLEEGPFTVRATANPPGEAERAGASAEGEADLVVPVRWRAQQEAVPVDANDLLLVLQAPEVLAGRVVDDEGTPVAEFQLEARSLTATSVRERQGFQSAEGMFVFERAGPGAWSLTVAAEGHVMATPLEINLPRTEPLEIPVARTATVEGVVVDPSGAPLAETTVFLEARQARGNPWARDTGPQATTDAAGRFQLDGLTPGSLELVAEHEGWASSEPLSLDLAPGEVRDGQQLVLRRGGRIEGKVVTPEGDPIASKRVVYGSNAMGFGSKDETLTDAEGRFAFERVTPGEWAVSAAPSMAEMGERMRGRRDPSAFVEVMGELVTESVTVVDEETVVVYLGGEPKRPVRVYGIVERGGVPLAGAQVYAVSEGSAVFQGMKTTRSADDGSYSLIVDRPGPYVVSAQLDEVGVESPVDVPRDDAFEVVLTIPDGGIEGVVRRPDGSVASGVRLGLQREDGLGRVRWNGAQATADAEGRYRFPSLEEGVYTVRANVGGWGGSKQDGFGTSVVTGIRVREDAFTDGVDFRLEQAGTLRGNVRGPDGRAIDGAAVFFRDEAGALVNVVSGTQSDSSGAFSAKGLAPGRYRVSARAEGFATGAAVDVTVRSGEESEVTVTCESGSYLLVSVEDENGDLQRTRVQVFDEAGDDVAGMLSVRELQAIFNEGRSATESRVGPFAPGRYRVRAVLADGRVEERRVRLRAGTDEKKVQLKLR